MGSNVSEKLRESSRHSFDGTLTTPTDYDAVPNQTRGWSGGRRDPHDVTDPTRS